MVEYRRGGDWDWPELRGITMKTTHDNRYDQDSGNRTEMDTIRQVQASYGAQALLEAWSGEEEARARIFLRNKKATRERRREKNKEGC